MTLEDKISTEFRTNNHAFFQDRLEYASVSSLLLYWKNNDLDGIAEEINTVQELFEKDLGYQVKTYEIPLESPQLSLKSEIVSLIREHSNSPDSLIILYYSGHGDADEDGRARWTALEAGGPTLSWYRVQDSLYDAVGDVLVLLDCCNSALITPGEKKTGKFELLSASAKGVKTPQPGKSSFTSILVKTIRKHLKTKAHIAIRELHTLLSHNSKLTETPQHIEFVLGTITLRAYQLPQHSGFVKRPSAHLFLQVSLTDDLTAPQIAQWLKSNLPSGVTAVDIEALVLKAKKLQGLVGPDAHHAFPPGSILDKLSVPAKTEILRHIQGLHNTMSVITNTAADEGRAFRCLEELKTAVSAACGSVETAVIQDLPEEDLQHALDKLEVSVIEGREAILLRQHVQDPGSVEDGPFIPLETINISGGKTRFRYGLMGEQNVLVDSFQYNQNLETLMPFPEKMKEVKRIAGLLSGVKNTRLHILPCKGFILEKAHKSLGLVFEVPLDYESHQQPIPLSQLFPGKTKKRKGHVKTVPLGDRIRLGHALAEALESFHRVGWVHKEIWSDSIFFLPKDSSSTAFGIPADAIDWASPWLLGFECARADADDSRLDPDYAEVHNLYRHPDRWGKPREKFIKPHDVYSLGVVLLEILRWDSAESVAYAKPTSEQKQPALIPEEVKARYTERCHVEFPHRFGQVLADITLACLEFKERTHGMREYDMQLYFQQNILSKFVAIEYILLDLIVVDSLRQPLTQAMIAAARASGQDAIDLGPKDGAVVTILLATSYALPSDDIYVSPTLHNLYTQIKSAASS
ncbi:hypothetical protein MMC30_006687 [Trapelia coarctata]|nr:hypothetical protein [Trapelia coarctata]